MMNVTAREAADPARLDELIAAERDALQRDRYRAARLALGGREAEDVAAAVGRSRTFVQTWAYRYRDGGVAALTPRRPPGRRPALTPEQRASFRARVLAGPAGADGGVCAFRGEDCRRIPAAEYGVAHSLQGVYDLLAELHLSPLRPRPRHRKNDPAAAGAWLASAPLLSPANARPAPASGSRSHFRDEARIGQQGTLTHVRAETGSRPEAVRQTEYDWCYLYASVDPLTGVSSAMVAPTVNAAWMSEHLRMVGEAAGEGVHVVLVLDGAGWHVAKDLAVPANLTLLHLPPYSPKLKPVERVWHYLRDRYLSNRVYRDYDHVFDATCAAWCKLDEGRLTSICATGWLTLAV